MMEKFVFGTLNFELLDESAYFQMLLSKWYFIFLISTKVIGCIFANSNLYEPKLALSINAVT